MADEFILKRPGGCDSDLAILYQTTLACLGEGEQVDIWFGLRDADPAKGDEIDESGELVGHTWATLRGADGKEHNLWEVGRRTPPAGAAQEIRAFNAYREALAVFRNEARPHPLALPPPTEEPKEWKGKPVISRAFAPSNLYYSSSRTWLFVDLSTSFDATKPAVLSRPMRAFDALVLAALLTLVFGKLPLVFGISSALEGLGKMPTSYSRTHFEGDERMLPAADRPLLVM